MTRVNIIERKHLIELFPQGKEEGIHENDFKCECGPYVTLPHHDAKPILDHNPLNEREAVKLRKAA